MNQVGIDISNDVFDAAMQHGSIVLRKQFSNTKTGHRQFIRWALYQASSAQVCLEATGIYHLQLALAWDRCKDISLMVVNPCAARRFAQAHMVRAKTDAVDADDLLQFLQRMEFRLWSAPREELLQLQSITHRLLQLDKEVIRERSRLHAARRAGPHTCLVQQDIQAHIAQMKQRLKQLRLQAYHVINDNPQLAAMESKLMHELVHWGRARVTRLPPGPKDGINEKEGTNELGWKFEQTAYGSCLTAESLMISDFVWPRWIFQWPHPCIEWCWLPCAGRLPLPWP